MFCKECGAQVADGDMFCAKCGTAVESEDEESKSNRKRKLAASVLGVIGGVCLLLGAIGYMIGGNSTPVSSTRPTQESSTTNQTKEKTWNEIGPNDILSEKHLRRFWQEFFEEECRKKRYGIGNKKRDQMINLLEQHIQAGDKLTKTQVAQEISRVLEEIERQEQAELRRRQEEEERQRRLNSPQNQLSQFIQAREPIMNKANDAFVALTATILDVVASPSPNQIPRLNQIIQVLNETRAEYENQISIPSAFTGDNALTLDTVMKQDVGYMAFMKEYAEIHKRMLQGQATQQDRRNTSVCEEFIRKHGGVAILREFANRMGVNANIKY